MVTDPMSAPLTVDVVASFVTTWKLARTATLSLSKKGTALEQLKLSSKTTTPVGLMSEREEDVSVNSQLLDPRMHVASTSKRKGPRIASWPTGYASGSGSFGETHKASLMPLLSMYHSLLPSSTSGDVGHHPVMVSSTAIH
jgi:hypothetical protein